MPDKEKNINPEEGEGFLPFEEEHEPDRPLECSECKKPIQVIYTEVIGDVMTHTSMCADCPELQRRLYGETRIPLANGFVEGVAGLACGNCGTTLEAIHVGTPLGCSVCYEVFNDILYGELVAAEKVPSRIATAKKTLPLHIGRVPGQAPEMSASLRLLALNEALNETLKREDYEQAAWLRDQIKALTDNAEATGNEGKP